MEHEEICKALDQLDGTTESRVAMLAGITREEVQELGGVQEEPVSVYKPIDVDAILASLGDEFKDPGPDPWGGANLDWGPRTPAE